MDVERPGSRSSPLARSPCSLLVRRRRRSLLAVRRDRRRRPRAALAERRTGRGRRAAASGSTRLSRPRLEAPVRRRRHGVRRSPTLGDGTGSDAGRATPTSRRRRIDRAGCSPTSCCGSRWSRPPRSGYGVRRALAPETRNRIRFEMRREVKRVAQAAAAATSRRRARPAGTAARSQRRDAAEDRGMMARTLLVRRPGRGRGLRDDPGPAGRRGAHRRRAARPARRPGRRRAAVPRRGRAGPAEKETELRERLGLVPMGHPSWSRRPAPAPAPEHRPTDEEGSN